MGFLPLCDPAKCTIQGDIICTGIHPFAPGFVCNIRDCVSVGLRFFESR